MKYFLFGLCLLSLISSCWGETRNCYDSCSDTSTWYWECDAYYTSCYQCNNNYWDSYDTCISDCGWFYVTDCDSCDCSSVSTGGICVIIFSLIFCCFCCGCIGRNRRRNRRVYARNAGMNAPLRSAPPVAAVGVITTTTTPAVQQVSCICGSAMILGVVQQGQPKCANMNCNKDIMSQAGGNCYYCPNNISQMHPTGFFYCSTCAMAVRSSGGPKLVAQQPVQGENAMM
mmetsp:Transcript_3848/g.3328  ORF Transcript_3848/g.3328 Transcript_3848/m.3328 type:complete len:229 (+) Transcript_3848:45-731(+)